jgi:hypothetical protein
MNEKFKENDIKTHRPLDTTDPGFSIVGYELRWLAPKVVENSPGRPFFVVSRDSLPDKLTQEILRYNPFAFREGNTIRRGDLVLAAVKTEHAEALRREKAEMAEALQARLRAGQASGFKTEYSQSTIQGPDRFKK